MPNTALVHLSDESLCLRTHVEQEASGRPSVEDRFGSKCDCFGCGWIGLEGIWGNFMVKRTMMIGSTIHYLIVASKSTVFFINLYNFIHPIIILSYLLGLMGQIANLCGGDVFKELQ